MLAEPLAPPSAASCLLYPFAGLAVSLLAICRQGRSPSGPLMFSSYHIIISMLF